MKKAKFITISGVDAAGKSTQRFLLSDYAKSNGISYHTVWMRYGNTPLLLNLSSKFKSKNHKMRAGFNPLTAVDSKNENMKDSAHDAGEKSSVYVHTGNKQKGLKKRIKDSIKLTFGMADICFNYIRCRKLRKKYSWIIFDRYIEDSMIDLHRRYPEVNFEKWLSYKLLYSLVPKPDFSVLLMLDTETQIHRLDERGESYSVNALKNTNHFYRNYVELGKWDLVIDATEPIDTIHKKIIENIK